MNQKGYWREHDREALVRWQAMTPEEQRQECLRIARTHPEGSRERAAIENQAKAEKFEKQVDND